MSKHRVSGIKNHRARKGWQDWEAQTKKSRSEQAPKLVNMRDIDRIGRPRRCLLDTATVASGSGLQPRPIVSAVWARRIYAKRFIFDADASARIGEMLHGHLDMIVDNIEFARFPFPTSYYELNLRALWSTWRPDWEIREDADERLGFMVHDGMVIMATTGKRPDTERDWAWPEDLLCGLAFRINRPQSVPLTKLTGTDDVGQAELVRASYVFGGQRILSDEVRRDGDHTHLYSPTSGLRGTLGLGVDLPKLDGAWTHAQVAGHFDIQPALTPITTETFVELCFMSGGDPLFLTTALLLLNQPSKYVVMDYVPREIRLERGKRKVFQEHHVIRLHLNRPVKVRDIFNLTNRAAPRAHTVSGHWKQYNKSIGCDHHHPDKRQAWEPVGSERSDDGDYKRYWCPLCLQRRTWTEHYDTGGDGISTTEYEVKR